jgi:hypothetical protein
VNEADPARGRSPIALGDLVANVAASQHRAALVLPVAIPEPVLDPLASLEATQGCREAALDLVSGACRIKGSASWRYESQGAALCGTTFAGQQFRSFMQQDPGKYPVEPEPILSSVL